jgi:UDP-N-acetylmuramate dehydrogenase
VIDEEIRALFMKELPGAGLLFDEPMSAHTSLHIGGPADVMIRAEDHGTVSRALELSSHAGFPSLPLGGGTNVLVRDGGVEGALITLPSASEPEAVEEDAGRVVLRAGAGLALGALLAYCRREGLSGMEGLAGIPGQVGGAIAGNAGSYGMEVSDVLSTVSVMAREGSVRSLKKEDIPFGYRSAGLPEGSIILGAEFRLRRESPAAVSGRMTKWLEEKKSTQPLGKWSAGCVFENPPGESAGRLVDRAGCKGLREGAIEVSATHANFFINTGGGRAEDFLVLMERVAERVRTAFGVSLEPEIHIIGRN